MKNFKLYMAIAMFILTTMLILTLMLTFDYSRSMACLVTFVSITGYMVSALYFYNYKHNTKDIG